MSTVCPYNDECLANPNFKCPYGPQPDGSFKPYPQICTGNQEKFEAILGEEGDVHLRSNGFWGKHLGWFSPSQVKMHLMKNMMNTVATLIPDLILRHPEPKQAVSLFTNEVFAQIKKPLNYERTKGLLQRDANMEKLVESMQKALIYMIEEDNYYRAWWGFFLLTIWEMMNDLYEQWDPTKIEDPVFKRLKYTKNGKRVELEEWMTMPEAKDKMFRWWLGKHLGFLSSYNVQIRNVRRNQK